MLKCYKLLFSSYLSSSVLGELGEHGIALPPNMQGLTDEQIVDLKLVDEWEDSCVPSGGAVENKDPIGRRNGKGNNEL